jgi:glycosyltransferase involved in cell wall biosynthesis
MMRIVFFTHYFPPEGNAPASRTYEHCVRWVKAGHEVTVITCAPNVPNGVVYEGYQNRFWPQRETIDGIDVIRVWTYVAANTGGGKRIVNYVSYMVSAVFTFLFFCRRPNLVIATSPQFFCGWAGTISSILKWCPFVLEIRDIWPESIVAVGALKKGFLIRCLEVLEKWMYQSATHIVTVGKGYQQQILKRAPGLENISVITNGVDLNSFLPRPPDETFIQQWGLADSFVCSYVGTIGLAHGLEIVVEAADILKQQGRDDIKFCLVGDGANRSSLEAITAERDLQSHIVFTGRLPKEQMAAVLASSNVVLIHLKKCDLFTTVIPSKIFEAMAMGRPLIMGVDGEAREIVQASGSGLDLSPGDAVGLAQIVCRLADEPELLAELGQAGRKFVAANYTREELALRYLKMLTAVANHQTVIEPAQSVD